MSCIRLPMILQHSTVGMQVLEFTGITSTILNMQKTDVIGIGLIDCGTVSKWLTKAYRVENPCEKRLGCIVNLFRSYNFNSQHHLFCCPLYRCKDLRDLDQFPSNAIENSESKQKQLTFMYVCLTPVIDITEILNFYHLSRSNICSVLKHYAKEELVKVQQTIINQGFLILKNTYFPSSLKRSSPTKLKTIVNSINFLTVRRYS